MKAENINDRLVRIGVFYDGNYFLQVSNYYAYGHQRRRRISISGLHEFIRHQVAAEESSEVKRCQIVDAHYFRGRINAAEASQRGDMLYYDRVFEDILMSEGVTTHYLPIKGGPDGHHRQEKGVDVWLALEAYELAYYKQFSVLVLIASDGDFVPLARKLNTLGTRVMVLSWDFEYTNEFGQRFITRTSQDLLEEVTYPMAMHEIIDNRVKKNDPLINNLFVQTEQRKPALVREQLADGEENESEILSLKNGFGFIRYPPNNLFFHYSSVENADFNDLQIGDKVAFTLSQNQEGQDIATNIRILE